MSAQPGASGRVLVRGPVQSRTNPPCTADRRTGPSPCCSWGCLPRPGAQLHSRSWHAWKEAHTVQSSQVWASDPELTPATT